ncbi:MAG: MazG nucleotide pyrophosphohydrolase domain-containing protein [Candidatus Hodarchaeota archaeon]
MDVKEFQELMKTLYLERDTNRGTWKTFSWFIEEIGELSEALRKAKEKPEQGLQDLENEFADVLAWLCSLANLVNVDLEKTIKKKYPGKCLKCGNIPCSCEKV